MGRNLLKFYLECVKIFMVLNVRGKGEEDEKQGKNYFEMD